MKPTIGRVVHYRLPEAPGSTAERLRPAFVVQVFERADGEPPMANLTVFLDGLNDLRYPEDAKALTDAGASVINDALASIGSAHEGTAPGEWRWPARA